MRGQDYLHLAETLVTGSTEAEWRSAVSRGYYAVFHVARTLLQGCGFAAPQGDQAHAYLWLRLSNAGHPDVQTAGGTMQTLRRNRNWADYDFHRPFKRVFAATQVQLARDLIVVLEAAAVEPVKTQITNVMRLYERNVLKTVTWHP